MVPDCTGDGGTMGLFDDLNKAMKQVEGDVRKSGLDQSMKDLEKGLNKTGKDIDQSLKSQSSGQTNAPSSKTVLPSAVVPASSIPAIPGLRLG
ncbi:MAG: hypothetical protein WC593_00330 [Methanoregula sp.]